MSPSYCACNGTSRRELVIPVPLRYYLNMLRRIISQILLVAAGGALLATLFTALGSQSILAGDALPAPYALPTPEGTRESNGDSPRAQLRIGIVSGHWGNDSGAVCPDGLTEMEVNLTIASLVQQKLSQEGFTVDLLKEFDPRLQGYRAQALLSIHADSCQYINDQATGFKIAPALGSSQPERTARLTACLKERYAARTGLSYHNSVTPDMSSYHAFSEIDPDTPAAIIESGFLNLDREILTQQPELIAQGIVDGLLCYLYNQPIEP